MIPNPLKKPLVYVTPHRDRAHMDCGVPSILGSIPDFLRKVPEMHGHPHHEQLLEFVVEHEHAHFEDQQAFGNTALQIMRDMALAYHEAGHLVVGYVFFPEHELTIKGVELNAQLVLDQCTPMRVVTEVNLDGTIENLSVLAAKALAGEHFEPKHHIQFHGLPKVSYPLTCSISNGDRAAHAQWKSYLDEEDMPLHDMMVKRCLNDPTVRRLVGPVARFIYDHLAAGVEVIGQQNLETFLKKLHPRRIRACDGTPGD